MASARGASDGNRDREAAFAQLRQITSVVDVPVTADLEGGYDLDPGDLVDALLDAGAVGCNVEDTDHATGDGLLNAEARATYLAGIREAAERRGVGIVLNAASTPSSGTLSATRPLPWTRCSGAPACTSTPAPTVSTRLACATRRWWHRSSRNSIARSTSTRRTPLAALADAGAARISLGGGVHSWMMGELERRAKRLLAGDTTAFA